MTKRLRRKTPMWFLIVTCVYGAILASLTVLDRVGADRTWFGALNLYLPQIVWATPGVLLTVFSLKAARRWVWAPLLCVAWVLGPVMGFCWAIQGPSGPVAVRIMTWNVKYGGFNKITQQAIALDIDAVGPNVVLMQDAWDLLNGPIGSYFQGWNVRSDSEYIIASKFPLDEAEVRRIPFPGEEQTCLRCRLHIGAKTVILYSVHFQSPRQGLGALMRARREPRYLPGAIQELEENAEARFLQARALRKLIEQEQEPVIVAGDLNSPDASLACATLRHAGLHDAFSEAGMGYGYTYGHFLLWHRLHWRNPSWVRIDHIMLAPQLTARACWAGTKNASEHRPVIADVVFRTRP